MLAEIQKILDLHKEGRLSEKEAEDQITLYSQYASDPDTESPIIDVFGLGPDKDPDAYEDGKPKFQFHHLL
jgi:hypothetical protein